LRFDGATSLVDQLLPSFDVNEVHEAWVPATLERTYAAARAVTPREVRLLRPLMALRGVPGFVTGKPLTVDPSAPFFEQMLGLGFIQLGERASRELVVGAVGRFWSPAGNRPVAAIQTCDEFLHFQAPGYAKAVMNVAVSPSGTGSRISTETRVVGTDPGATRRFRLYWLVIGPWSGLLRRSLLRAVRERAGSRNA